MISLLPNSSASDTHGAYVLFSLLADPVAAKQRLDELVTERQAAIVALTEVKTLAKQNADREAASEKAAAANASRGAHLDAREEKLDARESALNAFERHLNDCHAASLDAGIAKYTSAAAA